MPENIRKNVQILICKACGKKHIIEKDMFNYSFTCEGCKNEIFVDETGVQLIIGNIMLPENIIVDNENGDLPVKEKVDEKDIERNETNEFETNEFALIQEG